MDYQELQDILTTLDATSYRLETTYVENDGEVTDETELMEAQIAAMKILLNGEGVDYLGRWLKGKEDRKKALKAEKDFIQRQMDATDRTISFIKDKIREVMDATGCEKVRGDLGYTFATATSVKTEVDKDLLRELYQAKAEAALAGILPADVTVTLSASVSKLEADAELPQYYTRTETPTVRFTKPRASKE